MLQTSPEIVELIESGNIAPFMLVRLGFTTPLLCTDHSINVTHNAGFGDEVYKTDTGLLSVSPPNALPDVARDLFNLVFEDAEGTLKRILDTENLGVPLIVTLGFLSMPSTEMTPYRLVIYRGRIGSANWSIEEDASIINIKCTGPLAKLLQITNRTTSDDSQRKINPNDTSLEFSHSTSDEKTLKWGDATTD